MGTSRSDVVVVGRGIVGAVAAWRAAVAGRAVVCLDPTPGDGASAVAAGMLAPVTEAEFGEPEAAALNVASAAAWPAFAAELTAASGIEVGLETTGILTVAFDEGDARELARLTALQRGWGLAVEELSAGAAREREPLLGPRVAAATWAAGDHQVDPRRVLVALDVALERAGVRTVPHGAAWLERRGGAVTGVVDTAGGVHTADHVVLAAGPACARLLDAPGDPVVPIRPVKGQVLRLSAAAEPWLAGPRIVRGLVQGRTVYVVGRADGEIVVGATSEDRPDERRVTAGGVFGLLRDARALLPGLDEAELVECSARARPATPDHLPVVGASGVPGLSIVTGHYRHGILQSAATARAVDDLLAGRDLDPVWTPASPARFTEVPA